MITIFTALYPEAKELIRALSLKKDMTQNHFQVFSDENNQIQIVITGASAIAAATAVCLSIPSEISDADSAILDQSVV